MADKRSRSLIDDSFRSLFFTACGNRCVVCGKEGELQLGHIQRHKDKGPATWDNLQPLCAKCNGENNQDFSMDDMRPPNWRSQFVKLVAQSLRTELRVGPALPQNGAGWASPRPVDGTENNEVISWERATFSFNSLLSPSPNTPAPAPSIADYMAVVDWAVKKGADHERFIKPPDEKYRSKLCAHVRRLGRADFARAFKEFLRQGKWFEDNRRIDLNPFQTFADNPDHYLREADEHARREAKKAAELKAAQENILVEVKKENERRRTNALIGCAKTPHWPGMAADDADFIEKCRALLESPRSVTDEEIARADDIQARYRKYFETSEKFKLLKGIEVIVSRITGGSYEKWTDEECREFQHLKAQINAATDNGPELAEYRNRICRVPMRWKQPTRG